jgi:hypothetical protein
MSKSTSIGWNMLVTFVIAAGIAAVWETAAQWVLNLAQDSLRSRSTSESISLGPDGEPLLVHSVASGRYRYTTDAVTTLDGQPKNINPTELYGAYGYLQGSERYIPEDSANWWERMAALNDGGVPQTYWYLVHDGQPTGRVYGVGFHSKTKTIVAHFGQKGFTQAPPPREEWFHIPGSRLREATTANVNASEPQYQTGDSFILLANDKLWLIDLAKREVKVLLECPGAYAVGSFSKIPEKPPAPDDEIAQALRWIDMPLAVRKEDSLFVVNKRTGAKATYPLPARLKDANLNGWQLADSTLLLDASWWDWENPKPSELIWIDSQGQVTKQRQLRMPKQSHELPIPQVWQENIVQPVPLAKTILYLLWSGIEANREHKSYWVGFVKVSKRAWLAALVLFAVCVIPAWAAYRRQKRYALPHAMGWAVFVFVMGLPGWVAYRFHRLWPIMDDCPSCKQLSPRDREVCTECGATFPPPPLKGIEVFA